MKKVTQFLAIAVLALGIPKTFAISPNSVMTADTPKTAVTSSYQVPILVYHSIGSTTNKKETSSQQHYRITTANFEAQMKYLSINGYHPVSFAAYLDSLQNGTKLPDKAVVLTFDDGWKTQYIHAVPVLEKYKFTATFFIVTSYPDKGYTGYMSWADLKYLVDSGFDIESHTVSHAVLTKVDAITLASELSDSKKTLENKLGIKVTAIAYPTYMENAAVRAAAAQAGYTGGRAGWGKYINSIARIYELKSQEALNNPNPFSLTRLPDLP